MKKFGIVEKSVERTMCESEREREKERERERKLRIQSIYGHSRNWLSVFSGWRSSKLKCNFFITISFRAVSIPSYLRFSCPNVFISTQFFHQMFVQCSSFRSNLPLWMKGILCFMFTREKKYLCVSFLSPEREIYK